MIKIDEKHFNNNEHDYIKVKNFLYCKICRLNNQQIRQKKAHEDYLENKGGNTQIED